jgi:hypothetical protein
MYGRRVWLRWSMIEQLETRALPSAVTPVLAASIALPDSRQGVAEIVSSTADVQRDRNSLAHSDGSGPDDQSRVVKSGSGSVVDPPDRNDLEPANESKLPRSLNEAPRGFLDEAQLVTRRTGPWPDALADDPQVNGQETTTGLNGGSASDFADATSLVVWSSGAAMPLMMSAAFLPGSFIGSDGRANVSAADTKPPGSAGNVVSELDLPVPAPQVPGAPSDLDGNEPSQLDWPVVESDRGDPVWTELLEGALHPDWALVDRELRQFLSGLRRLADHADRYEAGPIWPLGIGATMALLLGIRPSYGRLRLFRRSVQGLPRASGRRPIPFGPWPLGPR